jgi:hypothetical protein
LLRTIEKDTMKKQLIYVGLAAALAAGFVSCERSNKDSSQTVEENAQSDSTYLDNQDNNGQPTSGSEGGKVDETKGAPESGYGNANGTELSPSTSENSGSASQGGSDEAEDDAVQK